MRRLSSWTTIKPFEALGSRRRILKSSVSNKGQFEELEALAKCLTDENGDWPIAWESIVETTELTLKIA